MARRPPPLVLLPPSEGKRPGGTGEPWSAGRDRFGELDERRDEVLDTLSAAMAGDDAERSALLGVRGEALAAATAADRSVRTSPTMPAIERFSGVLYDALDHAHLPAASRRRAAAQVVVFSGAFGLLTPDSPIPDHKLKMAASLPGLGRLAPWWRPALTEALAPLVADRVVWDLLPNEHAAAWDPRATRPRHRFTVRFLDDVGTGSARRTTTVSHWNKLLKGALVRHVLATQIAEPDGLADFEHPQGYRYRPDLTSEADGVIALTLVARRP